MEHNHLSCAQLLLNEAAGSNADEEISNLVAEDGTKVVCVYYTAYAFCHEI